MLVMLLFVRPWIVVRIGWRMLCLLMSVSIGNGGVPFLCCLYSWQVSCQVHPCPPLRLPQLRRRRRSSSILFTWGRDSLSSGCWSVDQHSLTLRCFQTRVLVVTITILTLLMSLLVMYMSLLVSLLSQLITSLLSRC